MAKSREKVLLVSAEVKDVATMAALFTDRGYEVHKAYTGNDGIRAAELREPDVILLDIDLPDMSGPDVCRNLRLRNTTWSIPIILLAVREGVEDERLMRALELGANDYVKTLGRVELLGRVGVMLRMKRVEDKLRRLYIERTKELEWSNMELQTIRTQLILKNQMSTLGLMVAVAAHEIRSPAASIAGNLELVLSLFQEFAALVQQLPRLVAGGPPEHFAQLCSAVKSLVDLNVAAEPVDIKTRRTETRRIEALLEERGLHYPHDLPQNLAKFHMGDPEHVEAAVGVLEHFGEDILPLLFQLGELLVKVRNMRISIDRINAIVSSMKDYTHVDRDEVSQFNLHEGLDDTLTIMSYIFKGGVEVLKDYAPDVPAIHGHPGELNQVWTNILQNAHDAMDGRGSITVRTRMDSLRGQACAAVTIQDTGSGIPPDVLPHIFDSFFTTKDKGRGSGLGLDICKRIIEKHGGRIEVSSSTNGTAFTVKLPVSGSLKPLEAPAP